MKLYNTLTKKVDKFVPINDNNVGIYSCGPTVYDHIHIGNLSAFTYADILRRALVVNDYKVKHVMNITDVNDKIIDRGLQVYPELTPEQAMIELSEHYTHIFTNDMSAIGNDIGSLEIVKATDYVKQMQTIIVKLYEKKIAYIADDGVYFSIDKYKKEGKTYGQLSKISAGSALQARIDNDEYDKADAHDFALWKLQKPNEPVWEFSLDGRNLDGRPGWHIECSAMSTSLLGMPFDIHTGGIDLVFPHHENEIAQSTAGTDKLKLANYFVHNEHMLVDGKKMSKSLNNFYTLADVLERGFSPIAFRLFLLQSHYRSQSNFSWANLESAANRYVSYQSMADNRWQPTSVASAVAQKPIIIYKLAITNALADDLNTPKALSLLSEFADKVNNSGVSDDAVTEFSNFILWLDKALGLSLSLSEDISKETKKLIDERELARQTKSWQKADELRQQLETAKILVRDTDRGPIWSRIA